MMMCVPLVAKTSLPEEKKKESRLHDLLQILFMCKSLGGNRRFIIHLVLVLHDHRYSNVPVKLPCIIFPNAPRC